ncbi:MAG: Ig-like domain-containing protein [Actinobacteria bacterium]|nr:Ig-like domain-containing protein [Actinomycetota bacterium]
MKPGGGTYFVDPNQGGESTRLHLAEVFWARLVDIHDIDAVTGEPNPQPVFRDFPIGEDIQTDGQVYLLETNPITQRTRLVIQEPKRALDDPDAEIFRGLLESASDELPTILPKHDDGTSSPPFSFVARNSAIILRFDDLLMDDAEAERLLPEVVKLLTGYPAETPLATRMRFDPNHGAVVGGEFHSTRVIIDLTISEEEAAGMAVQQPLNSIGLPASLVSQTGPNVSIRVPTKVDPGSTQFSILRSLSGVPLAANENGPVDLLKPTRDIVRAMRSGNATDQNDGFLLDLNQPEILGGWPLTISNPLPDPTGIPGFEFVVDLRFSTVCRVGPDVGDILSLGGLFVEVSETASPPDTNGQVLAVKVRSLTTDPITPQNLQGAATFLTTFDPTEPVQTGCWLSFSPQAGNFPTGDVPTDAQVLVRFSEPMNPSSLTPFDTFMIIRGDKNTQIVATNIVVGDIAPSTDLKDYTFTPRLQLAHAPFTSDIYHVRVDGPTDLAGNDLSNTISPVEFNLDPDQPEVQNGNTVIRFNSPDEVEPVGLTDLRGQLFFDIERGVITPRPVSFAGYPADRTIPVPSIMVAFLPGVQTPLNPLGSKLQTIWRYCDLGWQVKDETKYNLDVFGLSWSPIGGQVISDFYERFEIALSHSRRLPDEKLDAALLPKYVNSGLVGSPAFFTDNILNDPLSPQKVVHHRTLGYQINPVDLFLSATGTVMMPFPLNRGPGEPVTYTWRDTAVLSKAGPNAQGIPLDIESGAPLNIEPAGTFGSVAAAGLVPSFGLPLLMEYRCFTGDDALGQNALDISLAINSSPLPAFRAYSSGGLNTSNQAVVKNPDLELVPSGGFNPGSSPPGKRTANDNDNSFYIGQLDVVVRISRVHTVWIDTLMTAPDYSDPIILPNAGDQPAGTEIVIEYRGATGFSDELAATTAMFDAGRINPYGDPFKIEGTSPALTLPLETVDYLNGPVWKPDIDSIDGAKFFQMRFTFFNNIGSGLNAELSAVGVAYENG